VLATFCMLIRNIASSNLGRETISRTHALRERLKGYMEYLLTQEALYMTAWSPTSSHTRNLMTAEGCACLWKMVQPYEPADSKMERLEEEHRKKASGGKGKKGKPVEPYMENFMLEDVVSGRFDFAKELLSLLEAQVQADDSESSNEVIEKACGLSMALAAADSVIKGMDEHVKHLERKGDKRVEQLKKLRPKQLGGKNAKRESMCHSMGKPFVRVLCQVLLVKNRSKAVVEKAAGALCVLLSDPDNLTEFKEQREALERFLSMSITKQERQLQQLVNRLNMFFNS